MAVYYLLSAKRMSEEDFDETPISWNAPKPASQEVTEQQYFDFEKTFSSVKSQLDVLLKKKNVLIAERKRLEKESNSIMNEKKSVDKEIENCIQETKDIRETLTKQSNPPKQKSVSKIAAQTEMLEFSTISANIETLKKKLQKLETKYKEEKKLWKYDKKNLQLQLQELTNQREISKQTIQTFQNFVVDKEKSSSNDEIFDEQQEATSTIFSTNNNHKPVASPLRSQSPSSRLYGIEEENPKCEVINSPLKVTPNPNSRLVQQLSASSSPNQSPVKKQQKTMSSSLLVTPLQIEEEEKYKEQLIIQPEPKPIQQPQFEIQKEFDFMPENYKIDFTYRPLGQPIETNKVNGRIESQYLNGDKVIEYRNQVKRIICRDGTIYTLLTNGDVSKKFTDGAEAYFFDQSRAIQLTLPDNSVHSLFSNGQKEILYPNNEKITVFPDQSTQYKKPNGDYQIHYSNGKVVTCINGVITNQ